MGQDEQDKMQEPSLDPYTMKLERFELFSTNQCYYLVGSRLQQYRVLKMDRTLIETNAEPSIQRSRHGTSTGGGEDTKLFSSTPIIDSNANNESHNQMASLADNTHTAKPTLRPLSDFLSEDPNVYSQEEIQDMLDMIHDGNRMSMVPDGNGETASGGHHNNRGSSPPGGSSGGGLKPLVKAYGIVGFIRFLDCYYLTLITRRSKVGSIGGNGIYTIKNTETIPLKPAEQNPPGSGDQGDPSSVLLSMWNRGKRSVGLGLSSREIAELRYQGLYQVVDMTKNFYFSYTYELTRSLQENFLATTTRPFPPPPFKEMYAWNHFLTREFESCLYSLTSFHWITPIVHGAFVQRKVYDYGRSMNIVLLARRSRHFAGTRYLKRGVSEEGKVANDVEHEQILHDESNSSSSGIYSSYLQVRGSIPTFWSQESSVTMPKPPIEINRVDPTYHATQLHFEDLMKRYSSPILVLDLVKQSEKREREVRVGNEYRHAIDYINTHISDPHKIQYCALDYSHISKHRNLDVSASLNEVSTWAVNQTGFFCSSPKWKLVHGGIIEPFTKADGEGAARLSEQLGIPVFPMEQSGVLRTNCIDCLDRTNVAQFSAGVEAIGQQLVVMGVRAFSKLDPTSNIVRVLIDMYVDIGDSIALQYGGSEAHKKVTASRTESNITGPIGKHKELLTSIRRYYSNAFTDRLKQDAMNLFLGYYLPYRHSVPLWEFETDYYLHAKTDRGTKHSMKTFQKSFGIDWNEEDIACQEVGNSSSLAQVSSVTRPSHLQRNADLSAPHETESQRIARVRKRCKAQNEALSVWWKTALQSNIKQRTWMQLGPSQTDSSLLPPRFERLYQPDRMGMFDRFFTRGWTSPVRRSHSSQHSDGPDSEAEGVGLIRVISENFQLKPKHTESGTEENQQDDELLCDFIQHGLSPPHEPALKAFLRPHEVLCGASASGFDFLGRIDGFGADAKEEYIRYVGRPDDAGPSYSSDTVEEFKNCLHDYSLKEDDVEGIHKLANSAHIGEKILFGPYRGLKKDESAIEVATAIHEQFNGFDLQTGGRRLAESELKRRGLVTAGVKQAISDGWKDFTVSEKQYTELVEGSVDNCTRSDLTTADSLRLYAMAFDESTTITNGDRMFLSDKPNGNLKKLRNATDSGPRTDSFVKKAQRLGIPVLPAEIANARYSPLFQVERRRPVPTPFEQINEDLFAKKDNRFIVFNGAGLVAYKDNERLTGRHGPVTKISQQNIYETP